MSTFGQRLREARKEAGMTQLQLARLVGLAQATISNIESERNQGSVESTALARALRVLPDWLAEGRGPKRRQDDGEADNAGSLSGLIPIEAWEHEDDLPDLGDFIRVPRLDVHLSAGHGREIVEVDLVREAPQVFRAEWVRRLGLKPSKLASMYAAGDSMEPRVHDGDSLLVDTSRTTVTDGKVYALAYAGELRVKRLYRRVDGGIIIVSDNERNYPRLEVPAEQMEHVRIIGRVMHVQGTGGL
ncbi:MAG: helix-turn-helix transcriptional regulator [Zoogloeaceae bacterium]|jgi:phage repressor protein C with HTH and peptisase S24 domain|nr:helix-turn-helix transcriptional regulator [Zoogloeaceae bacterium]